MLYTKDDIDAKCPKTSRFYWYSPKYFAWGEIWRIFSQETKWLIGKPKSKTNDLMKKHQLNI